MESGIQLDAIDRRILRALQTDGRMTYDVLASQVSLSPSATLRRVKRLEESGKTGRGTDSTQTISEDREDRV